MTQPAPRLEVTPPAASLMAGVARRDVTPPVGIYARMWGAALHDRAEGVHRPLSLTVLAVRSAADALPLILVSIDWVHVIDAEDLALLRGPLVAMAGGDGARVILACTHTHGVGSFSASRAGLPGGELIGPYVKQTAAALHSAAAEAVAMSQSTPATLTWATGRCGLATNRDMRDPTPGRDRYLTAYNPDAPADDTLLVGRVTRNGDEQTLATIVNYACHPTTLAWDNRLLSPDYVGAMRETIESHGGGLCLFLQGASGELAPAWQYEGDTNVADDHGRQLGYAALSALASMLPPGRAMAFERVVESGAPLGVWKPRPFVPSKALSAETFVVSLPLTPQPSVAELQRQMEACDDRVMAERIRRRISRVRMFEGRTHHGVGVWIWRLGGSLIVAQPCEAYSCFQVALRAAFPDTAVAVVNLANGGVSYLAPPELYDRDLYQVWVSPFDRRALPMLTERCVEGVGRLSG